MQLKPIETLYNGRRFRSRAEARVAVFLDTLGVAYQYEREGYDLGIIGPYLPDFDLGVNGFVEVKGDEPTPFEMLKCATLAQVSGRVVYLIHDEGACVFTSVDFLNEVGHTACGTLIKNDSVEAVDRAWEVARRARFEHGETPQAPIGLKPADVPVVVARSECPLDVQRRYNKEKAGAL